MKFVYILLLLLFIVPAVSADWNYDGNTTATSIDIVNETGFSNWMYYMMITNKSSAVAWEFPVVGLTYGIFLPFTNAFGGNYEIIFLILWFVFMLMVYRNSGNITIPAMAGVITSGAFSMLIPEFSWNVCIILLAVAIAAVLFKWYTDDD